MGHREGQMGVLDGKSIFYFGVGRFPGEDEDET